MKTLKIFLTILVILAAVTSGSLYLLSLGVANGGLGSSYPQSTGLTASNSEGEMAYKIYEQSCATPVTKDVFVRGLSKAEADDCNSRPNTGGISFIGGNGNEMYLLSRNNWDSRVLLATYYLLQRGFDGPEAYSLRMDCSAPGFEKRPKMTLGVHYGLISGQVKSYVESIDNAQPNSALQYVSGGAGGFSPEGTATNNTANSVSPHAYGQALDVYSYGCASVYLRLDSDAAAAKWACGYSKASDTVYQHSYFYPIKNIPIEIGFSAGNFTGFSSQPDSNSKPDAYKNYLLEPKPDLKGCNGGDVAMLVDNTCNPPIPPKVPITYTNAGCIAQNQPNNPTSYYKSSFAYNSAQTGFWSTGKMSRVQPFQFLLALREPTPDGCTCTGTSVPSTYPESEKTAYQNKTGPLNFVDPNLALAIPPEQKKGLDDDGLKAYLKEQGETSRKIIIETAMLFSTAKKNGSYMQANEYFSALVGADKLADNEIIVNQISAPTGGGFTLPTGYNPLAKLIYGANKNAVEYDPAEVIGRQRGLGYNSSENDRVHLGF